MKSRFTDVRFVARVFWALSLTAIFIWGLLPAYSAGWDVDVYKNAITALRAGHDPYLDAIAVQRAYQLNPLAYQPGVAIPYSYVYSPITLPLLRVIGMLPLHLIATFYWGIYFFFDFLIIWVGMQLVEEKERGVFGLLSSVAIFFPIMLESDVMFSGNIAVILYGLVFWAALTGWRRNNWLWFYVAVLVAGCCKAPMLTLLAIPVLSARRQWLPSLATGAAGVALFAMQPKIWPDLFHHYLQAVDLQFSFNRDFSSSPAGLIANALYFRAPYPISSLVAYLSYAIVVAAVLFFLSRKYLAGSISLKQWVPVLLLGTILLNPRVMEYDLTPITIPLTLVVWRFFARSKSLRTTIVLMAVYFAVINFLASRDHVGLGNPPWKLTAGLSLVAAFAAGSWNLWKQSRETEKSSPASSEVNATSGYALIG